ncbi:hypothetical protein L9F63_006995, partial [Diploptera punctata]
SHEYFNLCDFILLVFVAKIACHLLHQSQDSHIKENGCRGTHLRLRPANNTLNSLIPRQLLNFSVSSRKQRCRTLKTSIMFSTSLYTWVANSIFALAHDRIRHNLKTFDVIIYLHSCLMKRCRMILGDRLFKMLMKSSFYGHFVAGEDQYKIRPVLERLRNFGVKPIMDYSVEEDISQEEAERREVEGSVSEAGDEKSQERAQ